MNGIRGTKFRIDWDSGVSVIHECSFNIMKASDAETGTLVANNSYVVMRMDDVGALWLLNFEDDFGNTVSWTMDLTCGAVKAVWTFEEGGENSCPDFMSGKFNFID